MWRTISERFTNSVSYDHQGGSDFCNPVYLSLSHFSSVSPCCPSSLSTVRAVVFACCLRRSFRRRVSHKQSQWGRGNLPRQLLRQSSEANFQGNSEEEWVTSSVFVEYISSAARTQSSVPLWYHWRHPYRISCL